MSPAIRVLLPTNNWARLLLAPAILFIATCVDRGYLTDFWHHLARGQAMAEQGRIIDRDLFTYTVADEPFKDANWLTQLFYHWLFTQGGLPLVQVVNALTLAVMLGLLVWLCRRLSGSWLLACALGVFVFFGLWQVLIIRPQTFSLLLFVGLYCLLLFSEQRRWLLLFPPVIMALWANLHGGFPIGLVLVGSFFLASGLEAVRQGGASEAANRRLRDLMLCLGACALATLINPYGWTIYQYVQVTSARASGRSIDEWVPPGLNLLIGKLWLASLLGVIVLLAYSRRRPSLYEICLVVCFLPLACGSVRMIAWWLLVWAPVVAAHLPELLGQRFRSVEADRQPSLGAAVFCGILAVGMVLSTPWLERYSPLQALGRGTNRVEDDLAGILARVQETGAAPRVFSRLEWGEYLSWSFGPRGQVFMDGRIEIYPDSAWRDYSDVTRARADWQEILDRYQVDCLLLDTPFHEDLLKQVERSPRWRQADKSGRAVLYCRTDSPLLAALAGKEPALSRAGK